MTDKLDSSTDRSPMLRIGCTSCHKEVAAIRVPEHCAFCGEPTVQKLKATGPVPGKYTRLATEGVEGNRVTFSVKLGQGLADEVDTIRGDVSRSAWIRDAMVTKLNATSA